MALFLQIVGGFVIAIILLIAGFYFYLRIKLGDYFDEALNPSGVPLFIQLNEDFKPEWLGNKKVQPICSQLEAAGYSRCNAYIVPQMQGLKVAAFRKDPVWVALYEHPLAGHWVDFVAHSESGTEYTFTNATMGAEVDSRPECKKVHEPELDAAALAKRVDELLASDSFKPAPADFREFFENTYEKDMQYRLRHGGTSREEFERQAAADPKLKLKPEQIEEAFVETKLQELHQWSEACMQYYLRSLSEEQQEAFWEGSYSFMVPRRSYGPALVRYLADMGFLVDDEAENMSDAFRDEEDMYRVFDRINESRSRQLRGEAVAENDTPLDHRIYKVRYDVAADHVPMP